MTEIIDGDLWTLAVVTESTSTLREMLRGSQLDAWAFCYRVNGRWLASTEPAHLAQGDAWGLPVVWAGEVITSNCDRLLRCQLRASVHGWQSHHPVRRYALDDVEWYAQQWARALGAQLIYADSEGGDIRQAFVGGD